MAPATSYRRPPEVCHGWETFYRRRVNICDPHLLALGENPIQGPRSVGHGFDGDSLPVKSRQIASTFQIIQPFKNVLRWLTDGSHFRDGFTPVHGSRRISAEFVGPWIVTGYLHL